MECVIKITIMYCVHETMSVSAGKADKNGEARFCSATEQPQPSVPPEEMFVIITR